ncbi:MAG TPA: hypothetical protein VFA25_01945 [Actinomycetota bacterium]|nr:hypothetical protein [Actinomycetota bacterium]
MRRPTLIVLIVLFFVLVGATVAQVLIATQERGPYPGPTSPGQLPSMPG